MTSITFPNILGFLCDINVPSFSNFLRFIIMPPWKFLHVSQDRPKICGDLLNRLVDGRTARCLSSTSSYLVSHDDTVIIVTWTPWTPRSIIILIIAEIKGRQYTGAKIRCISEIRRNKLSAEIRDRPRRLDKLRRNNSLPLCDES